MTYRDQNAALTLAVCLTCETWVNVTVEIGAEFPNGAPDHIKRAVSENANSLGLKNKSWE